MNTNLSIAKAPLMSRVLSHSFPMISFNSWGSKKWLSRGVMDFPLSSRLRSFESCKFSLSCSSNDNLGAALRKKSLKVSYRYRTFSNVCAKKYITFFEDFIPRTSCECFADNCSLTKGGFFRVLNLVFGKLAIVSLTKDAVFFCFDLRNEGIWRNGRYRRIRNRRQLFLDSWIFLPRTRLNFL